MTDVGPTALAEAAIQMHELFLSYVGAGFSEYQACVILGTVLAAGIGNGSGSTE